MDLESKKRELLSKISSMSREKTMAQKNSSAKARLHLKEKEREYEKSKQETPEKRGKVVLFGQPGLFLGTLKSSLSLYCDVELFHNGEKAQDFIMDSDVPLVVMDMDPPNEWRECHDVFTTGKTMHPEIEYIIYTMNKDIPEEIEILEKQGAKVMHKPLDGNLLKETVNKILKKG